MDDSIVIFDIRSSRDVRVPVIPGTRRPDFDATFGLSTWHTHGYTLKGENKRAPMTLTTLLEEHARDKARIRDRSVFLQLKEIMDTLRQGDAFEFAKTMVGRIITLGYMMEKAANDAETSSKAIQIRNGAVMALRENWEDNIASVLSQEERRELDYDGTADMTGAANPKEMEMRRFVFPESERFVKVPSVDLPIFMGRFIGEDAVKSDYVRLAQTANLRDLDSYVILTKKLQPRNRGPSSYYQLKTLGDQDPTPEFEFFDDFFVEWITNPLKYDCYGKLLPINNLRTVTGWGSYIDAQGVEHKVVRGVVTEDWVTSRTPDAPWLYNTRAVPLLGRDPKNNFGIKVDRFSMSGSSGSPTARFICCDQTVDTPGCWIGRVSEDNDQPVLYDWMGNVSPIEEIRAGRGPLTTQDIVMQGTAWIDVEKYFSIDRQIRDLVERNIDRLNFLWGVAGAQGAARVGLDIQSFWTTRMHHELANDLVEIFKLQSEYNEAQCPADPKRASTRAQWVLLISHEVFGLDDPMGKMVVLKNGISDAPFDEKAISSIHLTRPADQPLVFPAAAIVPPLPLAPFAWPNLVATGPLDGAGDPTYVVGDITRWLTAAQALMAGDPRGDPTTRGYVTRFLDSVQASLGIIQRAQGFVAASRAIDATPLFQATKSLARGGAAQFDRDGNLENIPPRIRPISDRVTDDTDALENASIDVPPQQIGEFIAANFPLLNTVAPPAAGTFTEQNAIDVEQLTEGFENQLDDSIRGVRADILKIERWRWETGRRRNLQDARARRLASPDGFRSIVQATDQRIDEVQDPAYYNKPPADAIRGIETLIKLREGEIATAQALSGAPIPGFSTQASIDLARNVRDELQITLNALEVLEQRENEYTAAAMQATLQNLERIPDGDLYPATRAADEALKINTRGIINDIGRLGSDLETDRNELARLLRDVLRLEVDPAGPQLLIERKANAADPNLGGDDRNDLNAEVRAIPAVGTTEVDLQAAVRRSEQYVLQRDQRDVDAQITALALAPELEARVRSCWTDMHNNLANVYGNLPEADRSARTPAIIGFIGGAMFQANEMYNAERNVLAEMANDVRRLNEAIDTLSPQQDARAFEMYQRLVDIRRQGYPSLVSQLLQRMGNTDRLLQITTYDQFIRGMMDAPFDPAGRPAASGIEYGKLRKTADVMWDNLFDGADSYSNRTGYEDSWNDLEAAAADFRLKVGVALDAVANGDLDAIDVARRAADFVGYEGAAPAVPPIDDFATWFSDFEYTQKDLCTFALDLYNQQQGTILIPAGTRLARYKALLAKDVAANETYKNLVNVPKLSSEDPSGAFRLQQLEFIDRDGTTRRLSPQQFQKRFVDKWRALSDRVTDGAYFVLDADDVALYNEVSPDGPNGQAIAEYAVMMDEDLESVKTSVGTDTTVTPLKRMARSITPLIDGYLARLVAIDGGATRADANLADLVAIEGDLQFFVSHVAGNEVDFTGAGWALQAGLLQAPPRTYHITSTTEEQAPESIATSRRLVQLISRYTDPDFLNDAKQEVEGILTRSQAAGAIVAGVQHKITPNRTFQVCIEGIPITWSGQVGTLRVLEDRVRQMNESCVISLYRFFKDGTFAPPDNAEDPVDLIPATAASLADDADSNKLSEEQFRLIEPFARACGAFVQTNAGWFVCSEMQVVDVSNGTNVLTNLGDEAVLPLMNKWAPARYTCLLWAKFFEVLEAVTKRPGIGGSNIKNDAGDWNDATLRLDASLINPIAEFNAALLRTNAVRNATASAYLRYVNNTDGERGLVVGEGGNVRDIQKLSNYEGDQGNPIQAQIIGANIEENNLNTLANIDVQGMARYWKPAERAQGMTGQSSPEYFRVDTAMWPRLLKPIVEEYKRIAALPDDAASGDPDPKRAVMDTILTPARLLDIGLKTPSGDVTRKVTQTYMWGNVTDLVGMGATVSQIIQLFKVWAAVGRILNQIEDDDLPLNADDVYWVSTHNWREGRDPVNLPSQSALVAPQRQAAPAGRGGLLTPPGTPMKGGGRGAKAPAKAVNSRIGSVVPPRVAPKKPTAKPTTNFFSGLLSWRDEPKEKKQEEVDETPMQMTMNKEADVSDEEWEEWE